MDPGTPHLQRVLGTLEALWVWIQRNPRVWSFIDVYPRHVKSEFGRQVVISPRFLLSIE